MISLSTHAVRSGALAAVLLASVMSTGCLMGPNYKRPTVAVPPQFRGATEPATDPSLADTQWSNLFQDDTLTQLVRTALQDNFDIRIATERILQTRAQYGITRSQLVPTVDAVSQFNAVRTSSVGSFVFVPRGTNLDVSYTQTGFGLSWELDVWGRLRRLTESARAQYLATEEARRGVITTLIADVSTNYLALRELDLELGIAQKNRGLADDGLRITTLRRDQGVATGLDVRQAEQLLFTALSRIAQIEREIAQRENAINLLLGRSPDVVPRGKALTDFVLPNQVPAGLPSALLERRPDIRQAEQNLIAANAQIGAARAQFFPLISLTGLLGGQSRALTDLFTGPARQWNFVPVSTLPIFNAGRLREQVRFSESQQRETVIAYQRAIQNAFREVSDSLIGYQKLTEQRTQQEGLVNALRDSDRLSRLRYEGGIDSFLQVLDAQRNLFQGELQLAQLQREELLAVVQLYRALGGGWQQP